MISLEGGVSFRCLIGLSHRFRRSRFVPPNRTEKFMLLSCEHDIVLRFSNCARSTAVVAGIDVNGSAACRYVKVCAPLLTWKRWPEY